MDNPTTYKTRPACVVAVDVCCARPYDHADGWWWVALPPKKMPGFAWYFWLNRLAQSEFSLCATLLIPDDTDPILDFGDNAFLRWRRRRFLFLYDDCFGAGILKEAWKLCY
ncbi:MAG: hypothetical protein LBU11_06080 [Zoogloeaceae bacterium]|nr:hypothetical protein [Zoogloeaceae bacterium]